MYQNNSVFITNSGINSVTGGGMVSLNYVKALSSCTNIRYILCKQKFDNNNFQGIPAFSIDPRDWGYAEEGWVNPFFEDYLAFHLLQKEPTEIFMTYGCPMGLTIEEAKREFFCKVICDLAPHIIEDSKNEHIKLFGKYDYPHLVDEQLWGLYSRHLRFADVVIVHSQKSADYIKKKAKLNIDPTVIPHGCYLPEKIPDYPDKITPGYLGALGVDKGINYLVNAWIQNPHDSQMVIGGGNSESFSVDKHYAKYFRATGFLDNITDFYKQISFGVFPSVTEGFNIPALDCMAHKRPIIVSEGAGISELVEDGKNGFVIPTCSIDAVRQKIQYFYDNPEEIKRMGENARLTAEKHTWHLVNKKYVDIIEGLL